MHSRMKWMGRIRWILIFHAVYDLQHYLQRNLKLNAILFDHQHVVPSNSGRENSESRTECMRRIHRYGCTVVAATITTADNCISHLKQFHYRFVIKHAFIEYSKGNWTQPVTHSNGKFEFFSFSFFATANGRIHEIVSVDH